MTIYNSFDELPSVDQIQIEDEVHYSSRTWKWDGQKWTLYSESTVGDIKFNSEIPIEHTVTTTDGEDITVSHFFDLADLDPLQAP